MNFQEAAEICNKQGWSATHNKAGLWLVGPETSEGLIQACGHGSSFEEAVENAQKALV